MPNTEVTINIHDLSMGDIPLLMALDEKIFPSEMLMTHSDYEHLVSIEGGILVEAFEGTNLVGAAFGFPAEAIKQDVQENDADFEPRLEEFYSYSVGVLSSFQKTGLGKKLALALASEAGCRGWKYLSAHVRMRNGWATRRKLLLEPIKTRIIPGENYWEDPLEDMEYQLVDISKSS